MLHIADHDDIRFQLTRPRGARLLLRPHGRVRAGVSTHAPARGATQGNHSRPRHQSGFNSRAREGRDFPEVAVYTGGDLVSTHAPARGATMITKSAPGPPQFQLTRPRGARLADVDDDVRHGSVSTHAPARGATSRLSTSRKHSVFQLTRPRGARRLIHKLINHFTMFQLTRPRGARRDDDTNIYPDHVFQLTRPRGARLEVDLMDPSRLVVSTHAPARGATAPPEKPPPPPWVSTHAPARGATLSILDSSSYVPVSTHAPARGATYLPNVWNTGIKFQLTRPRGARQADMKQVKSYISGFNSRAREGRDSRRRGGDAWRDVSTHAPARGATWRGAPTLPTSSFQLTRPRGARLPGPRAHRLQRRFNSRAREGRDHPHNRTIRARAGFNSRAREGRDLIQTGELVAGTRVSTHAPARGATSRRRRDSRDRPVSTHAPARGATAACGLYLAICLGFNSRAREGRDAGFQLSSPPP